MILKIQDSINESKWYYYDNIAKISINHNEYMITKDNKVLSKDCQSNKKEYVELDADAVYAQWSHDNETEPPDVGVVVAIFRSFIVLDDIKSGDEMCVAFSRRAYLLNDEGRTIERIS